LSLEEGAEIICLQLSVYHTFLVYAAVLSSIMFVLLSHILVLSILRGAKSFTSLPQRIHNQIPFRTVAASSSTRLSIALPTNLEYLAVQRYNEPAYQSIQWMDPSLATEDNGSKEEAMMIVPIYPIPAVYLPYTNHTLNNVEPRNIQMALDLNQTDNKNKLFCVTMRATDTGRISKRGTLLRMVGMQPTYRQESLQDTSISAANKMLSRIMVSCEALGTVEIHSIENPQAAAPLQRLRRSAEYLWGRVTIIDKREEADVDHTDSTILQQLAADLTHIKNMYELGIGSQGTTSTMALRDLSAAIPSRESIQRLSLWEIAQLWQSVCETIRAGRQAILTADRNEFLVDAACRKGGPLKLPVHPEDLEPEDRQRLTKWETQVQNAFYNLQLDPCLDFLPLQSMDSDTERWQWLTKLIARERQRLEEAATLFQSTCSDSDDDFMSIDPLLDPIQGEPVRKGAWFDDGVW
jgi:hypothetical protein